MKRLLVVLLGCAALFAVLPGHAQAQAKTRECGLPAKSPLWVDYADGSVPYWPMFARPGVIAAAANFIYPAQLRALGAKTVYWEMNFRQRVGTPGNPLDPAVVQDWADRVFYRAVSSSACATPWIGLNEMWGSNLATPWSPTNAQYRQNVLIFVRRLKELGAHPYLLLSTRPFTDGEAGDWWREVALYTDFVREVYFAAPQLHRQGPVLASRRLRIAFRQGVTDLTDIGISPAKIGIFLGFHTNPGQGGREGLKPASAWFNTIKLQVLAVKQVSREIPLATIWSWGWGEWAQADRDPDKPAAACVYLWTRDPKLCAGPGMAGPGFDRSLTIGQLLLPGGVQCNTPWGQVRNSQLSSLTAITRDREVAYTSLFARLVLKGYVRVLPADLRAAERAIVSARFGGSGAAYRGALARDGASRAIALGVIADELRQARIARRFQVAPPSYSQLAEYQSSYSDTSSRLVQATAAQPWLGRRARGVAIEGMAPAAVFRVAAGHTVTLHVRKKTVLVRVLGPTAPLGAFSLSEAGASISAALVRIAQDQVFDNWLMRRESGSLTWTTCRRDWLPSLGTLELTSELPYLELAN
ncbi:MAG: hypothetical protein ABI896_02695 [Actinomycetota bacterium]